MKRGIVVLSLLAACKQSAPEGPPADLIQVLQQAQQAKVPGAPFVRPAIDGGLSEVVIDPRDPESYYRAGQEEFLKGEFDKAADHLRQSLRLAPTAKGWHVLGDTLLSQGRFNEAADAYREAVKLEPGKRLSWMRLGRALINSGGNAEAAQAFLKAQELKPEDPEAYREQAEALVGADRSAEAVASLQKAIELDPKSSAKDLKLQGQLLGKLGKHAEAAKVLAKSAELHPDPGVYNELGEVLVRGGELANAVKAFEEAAKLDAKDPTAWEMVGEIQSKLGNAPAAREAYGASLKVGDSTGPHLGLARLALAEGKKADASKELDLAMAVTTGEVYEARELALVCAKLELWPQANKLLMLVLEDPEQAAQPALWLQLARARAKLKMKAEVKQACERAKALLPKDDKTACP